MFLLDKNAYFVLLVLIIPCFVYPFPLFISFLAFLQLVLDCTFYGDENKEFNVKSAARDFKSYVKDNEDLLSADLVRSTS